MGRIVFSISHRHDALVPTISKGFQKQLRLLVLNWGIQREGYIMLASTVNEYVDDEVKS